MPSKILLAFGPISQNLMHWTLRMDGLAQCRHQTPWEGEAGDGEIVETREVADEHREGRWLKTDISQCQTYQIFEGRVKGMKHR